MSRSKSLRNRRILSVLLSSCLLVIIYCSLTIMVYAQSSAAKLNGDVVDQNGAVVPNATVMIVNPNTGFSREVTTDDHGFYSFPPLAAGTYVITVRREGFAPIETKDVILNVGDQKSLKIQLKAGDVNASVTVDSSAEAIRTDAAVSTVVDRQFVSNIPLNGRSFQSLITLTPGVVVVPSGTTNTNGQFSVNGQRAGSNNFLVDGVSANFGGAPGFFGGSSTSGNLPALTTLGTTQSLVSVDALEEFRVETSTYAAEYGRQPGGQISMVTRSGTNAFHGSIYDYVRNDIFDANDWFANRAGQPKPPKRQNNFGATLSGPILLPRFGEGGRQPGYDGRNRTFFFFSYEGLRLILPQFSLTNVPSLALRQQSPAGIQPLLNAFPIPNGPVLANGLAEFSSSYSDPSNLDATSIRVDHTVNSRMTLFARYNRSPSESVTRRANVNLSGILGGRLLTQGLTAGATLSLTPSASNEFRLNYSRNDAVSVNEQDSFGGAAPLPIDSIIPPQYQGAGVLGILQLNFAGRTASAVPLLSISTNQAAQQDQFNIVDNFSYGFGSHQLKFGVDLRRTKSHSDLSSYILNGTVTTQQQILAATVPSVQVVGIRPVTGVFTNFSAYGQDTWRISPRLSLDLGLRWDVNPAPYEEGGSDPAAVTQVRDLRTMQLAPLGTPEWKTTYNNFGPRIGMAYHLSDRAGRETTLRGGFGVFYDTGNDLSGQNLARYPYQANRIVTNVVFPLSPVQVAPARFPIETLPLTPPYPQFLVFDPELKLPYTLQWNLAVQQSLGRNQVLSVSYVAAAGRRLLQTTQANIATINPSFTTIQLIKNNATSDYHALQAQFQRRLSRGLQLLGSYTWSHALDDDSTGQTNRVAQHGNADFDVRHLFAAAATYDIPARGNEVARAILGGWSINTNLTARSALPVDIIATTLTDPVTGGLVNVRPNVISGVPFYVDDSTLPGGRRINRAAFTIPAAGQSGNFGRNQVRGIGAWQVDFSLRRQLGLTERLKVELRGEAFNIFNHPNFGTIQTALTAANFGQATNMLNRQLGGLNQLYQIGGPRSFQFALKLLF